MYDKTEIKKKKLLLQLSNEVKEIELKIKYNKFINMNIIMVKYFKIILKLVQLICPYVLSISILAVIPKMFGFGVPIFEDNVMKKLGRIKGIDNLGNIRYEELYGDYFERENFKICKNINTITLYNKWNKINDNLDERTVIKYNLNDLKEEDIINLLNDPLYLESILGSPIMTFTEKRNSINELDNKEYVEAIMYSVVDDKIIYTKESVDFNLVISLIYILLSIISSAITFKIRECYSDFSIFDEIDDINNKYKKQDLEVLIKKLEIRKDNYNRLSEK